MSMNETFKGFTPEAVDFLWGIRMNNNRDWFLEHKQQYVSSLYEPMKALGSALFQPFLDQPGSILKVSRIYRDARLHHPDPYKESLWLCIRHEVSYWGEHPCLFLEIRPEGVTYGFGLHAPKVAAMDGFRQYISAHPAEFQALVRKTERETGIPISADLYKKPKPTENPELETYFRWKGNILCVAREPVGPEMFSPDLQQRAKDLFTKLTPLYDFFNRILAEP